MNLKTVTGAAVELSEITFGREFNEALVHQVVTAYLAGARQGTRAQKKLVAKFLVVVKKPWRQKGTGRARAGSIRSPIWVGGGRAFAAKPQDWSQKSKPQNVSWCNAVHFGGIGSSRAFGFG